MNELVNLESALEEFEQRINEIGVQFIWIIGEELWKAKQKVIEITGDGRASGFIEWADKKFKFKKAAVARYIKAYQEKLTDPVQIWGHQDKIGIAGDTDFPQVIHKPKLYSEPMESVLPTIGPFDLIVADPPYNVTPWAWDKIDNFIIQTKTWLELCKAALKESYHLFWFCSPNYSSDIEMIFRELELPIQSRMVWHRRNMAMGSDAKNKFIDTWEMIFHSGNRPLNFSKDWDDKRFDVQTFAVPQTNFTDTKYHPTQKPIELIKILVEAGSYDGDDVLDPFAGSGTTAATYLNRNFTLIEKEQEYIDVIKKRFDL